MEIFVLLLILISFSRAAYVAEEHQRQRKAKELDASQHQVADLGSILCHFYGGKPVASPECCRVASDIPECGEPATHYHQMVFGDQCVEVVSSVISGAIVEEDLVTTYIFFNSNLRDITTSNPALARCEDEGLRLLFLMRRKLREAEEARG